MGTKMKRAEKYHGKKQTNITSKDCLGARRRFFSSFFVLFLSLFVRAAPGNCAVALELGEVAMMRGGVKNDEERRSMPFLAWLYILHASHTPTHPSYPTTGCFRHALLPS